MSNANAKHYPDPSTLLHHIVELETFARGNGLDREADELHAISTRMRVTMASGADDAAAHVMSLEDARRVVEELRRERQEGPLQDIQRALA